MTEYQFQDIMGGHVITVDAHSYIEALEKARQVLTSPRLYQPTKEG